MTDEQFKLLFKELKEINYNLENIKDSLPKSFSLAPIADKLSEMSTLLDKIERHTENIGIES